MMLYTKGIFAAADHSTIHMITSSAKAGDFLEYSGTISGLGSNK
jgi:hypothetical protein